MPVGEELTTQQAADLLNVSQQYLLRLLETDRIPYKKAGERHMLRAEDVRAFKEMRDQERRRGLAELTRLTQEFGGYDNKK
jgi:excisionase family DNA binding protein